MKIHLHFVAMQSEHLPAEGKDILDLKDGASLTDAMQALGLDENNSTLTLLNDSSIAKSQRGQTRLADGDTLTLFSPIKGG